MSNDKKIDDKKDEKVTAPAANVVKPKPKKVSKKIKEKEYSEETLNISLYYEISSTIYNSLINLIVRKVIISDENILKILELQIANLLLLEKKISELKNKNYAREFLQIISNLINRGLSVTKSESKNRIEMLEERNLLIVTITNICKTVERESLERIRQFSDTTFTELNDQILALTNFSDITGKTKTVTFNNNNDGDNNVSNPVINDVLNNNQNINNLDSNSLANLTKMGVLPQHPVTNPKFYPYLSKPKYIPLLKKVLAAFLLFTTLLSLVAYIITFFVAGTHSIADGGDKVYYNLGNVTQSLVLTIITTAIIDGGFLYSILKPAKLGRDTYRTSYFLIVILIIWIIFTVASVILMTTDKSLIDTFDRFLKQDSTTAKLTVDPGALPWLKSLGTFKAFRILAYILTASAIFPIAITLVIAILNPKIDRNKILKANVEYKNAINSALNGKTYEIDPSLFDDNLQNKKDKNSHKFWRNSDLFK